MNASSGSRTRTTSVALGVTDTAAATGLALTGAIAASYGFALPVATPPNAIVFGAGEMTRNQKPRAGVLLDVVIILVATGTMAVLIRIRGRWCRGERPASLADPDRTIVRVWKGRPLPVERPSERRNQAPLAPPGRTFVDAA